MSGSGALCVDQGFHTIVEPEPFLSTTIRRPSFGSTTWICAVDV